MTRGWLAGGVALFAITSSALHGAQNAAEPAIELELRPRVCTLSANDAECDTVIEAQWRSVRDQSLCLLIVGRPEIKQCWENHSAGRYTVALVFRENLRVELRDPALRSVLASEAIMVIREALQLRRKRRPPWSVFP